MADPIIVPIPNAGRPRAPTAGDNVTDCAVIDTVDEVREASPDIVNPVAADCAAATAGDACMILNASLMLVEAVAAAVAAVDVPVTPKTLFRSLNISRRRSPVLGVLPKFVCAFWTAVLASVDN